MVFFVWAFAFDGVSGALLFAVFATDVALRMRYIPRGRFATWSCKLYYRDCHVGLSAAGGAGTVRDHQGVGKVHAVLGRLPASVSCGSGLLDTIVGTLSLVHHGWPTVK